MPNKIKVGVIFGGVSAEHEVSLVSGASVIKALDRKKYEVIPIGLTKKGEWLVGASLKFLKGDRKARVKHILPPTDFKSRGLILKKNKKISVKKIDVFFPVLHGPYGEDGTVQGLLEISGIPCVGSGVLGSALGMDKVVQKQIYQYLGIPTPKFLFFNFSEGRKSSAKILKKIKKEINFPCFVKPANLGSSVGISKVKRANNLKRALDLAFKYDSKVIIEKGLENCREIEIAVLGNDQPRVSIPGEIISSGEFYDYDAKYVDGRSKTIVNPKLKKTTREKIKKYAKEAFLGLNCQGLARADFLVRGDIVYLNELNTMPGFTSISMYPKLWQASGLPYPKLLDELIRLAFEKHQAQKLKQTGFKPKNKWYG